MHEVTENNKSIKVQFKSEPYVTENGNLKDLCKMFFFNVLFNKYWCDKVYKYHQTVILLSKLENIQPQFDVMNIYM